MHLIWIPEVAGASPHPGAPPGSSFVPHFNNVET
jgi:hypothetical protein